MRKQITLRHMNAEKIRQDAQGFTPGKDHSYLESYPHFITYFKEIPEIETKHLVIGSHFVYGWMPRVLTLKRSGDKQVLDLFNKAKRKGEKRLEKTNWKP